MIDRLLSKFKLARGRAWQAFLRQAELFVYLVAGFPMAVRYFRKTAPSDSVNYIHWFHSKRFWRLPFGPLKALIAIMIWPILLIVAIGVFTARNGQYIQSTRGISIFKQITTQIQVAVKNSIAPFWYYMFELYDDERRTKAGLYLTAHETIGPAFTALQPRDGSDRLADKVTFAAHCKNQNIRAVPVFFHVSAGAIVGGGEAPKCDLFVKPRQGNGGHHSERWDYAEPDQYRNSHGKVETWNSLVEILCAQSLTQDFIVQPRLENHQALADISNGALVTARIFTIRNEEGRFEATNAAFRMAIGKNNVVDNFHQGGLATAVDLKTGRIGEASDMGIKPGVGWRTHHPISGVQFSGRYLPMWADAVALAVAAHYGFPQHIIVGWDVAMLADGVCIIEGNAKPDLDIHQRVERGPLGLQRIADLIAFNLKRCEDA